MYHKSCFEIKPYTQNRRMLLIYSYWHFLILASVDCSSSSTWNGECCLCHRTDTKKISQHNKQCMENTADRSFMSKISSATLHLIIYIKMWWSILSNVQNSVWSISFTRSIDEYRKCEMPLHILVVTVSKDHSGPNCWTLTSLLQVISKALVEIKHVETWSSLIWACEVLELRAVNSSVRVG